MNRFPISQLYDEKTFYKAFLADLEASRHEIIVESPYITLERTMPFMPVFKRLVDSGIKIDIITRDPKEHEYNLELQSEEAISIFERIGVQVLICSGNHHRKLAIIDREILYEGSLNILSQTKSREIMRRIKSKKLALEMFNFLKLANFI